MSKIMLGYKFKGRRCVKSLKLNMSKNKNKLRVIEAAWESHVLRMAQTLNKSYFPLNENKQVKEYEEP